MGADAPSSCSPSLQALLVLPLAKSLGSGGAEPLAQSPGSGGGCRESGGEQPAAPTHTDLRWEPPKQRQRNNTHASTGPTSLDLKSLSLQDWKERSPQLCFENESNVYSH